MSKGYKANQVEQFIFYMKDEEFNKILNNKKR